MATRSTVSGQIKGAAFREFAIFAASRLGDRLSVGLAGLPPELSAQLNPEAPALGVLASKWYDAELVHALLDALVGDFGPAARMEFARDGAAAVMQRTLRGMYRVLFQWMATPERYARYAGKLWSAYYDSGHFEVDLVEPDCAIATIRGWHSHHRFMCDLNREAATQIYSAMGCREVATARTACVSEGHAACVFETRWRGRSRSGG